MKPRRFDTFMFNGHETEMLLLECRLTELYDTFDKFVIVEATVDHQDHPKPLNFLEQECRFAEWRDKIHYVVAENLPIASANLADRIVLFDKDDSVVAPIVDDWSWAREHAQREWIGKGLEELDASDDDIIFQSDADEIPSILAARNVRPKGSELVSLSQRGHFWAIDWLYPAGWNGTVIGRWGAIKHLNDNRPGGPFAAMRDSRNANNAIKGGWHFSWLGGTQEEWLRKVHSFCHPEVEQRIKENADKYFREGIHVDGAVMKPVDVDGSWPRWMRTPGNVPATWLRPR